nr:nucleolar protein dao-5-like [Drosophila kikkawai]
MEPTTDLRPPRSPDAPWHILRRQTHKSLPNRDPTDSRPYPSPVAPDAANYVQSATAPGHAAPDVRVFGRVSPSLATTARRATNASTTLGPLDLPVLHGQDWAQDPMLLSSAVGTLPSPCSPRQQDPESDEDDDEEGDSRSPSPAAPTRDDDYVLEDVTDSDATPPYPGYQGEEASEQDDDDAQTISSDSVPDDGAPSAAHYRWEGEERYGFWRGSWIQLIHNHYTSIPIEAPFRPTPDPIITFPPSPERLCIMAPDEDWEMDMGNTPEVRPPSPALGEDAALPIFPGDRAGDNAPLASTSKQALHVSNQTYDDAPLASTSKQALHINQTYDDAPLASTSRQALRNQTYDDTPLASSSQGSIPTASETTEQGYQPTGKAMQWESESSDSETETGQKFRRKETRPRPPPNIAAPSHRSSVHRRGISTERNAPPNAAETNRRAANHSRSTINEEVTPPATPSVGPGDRGFDLSHAGRADGGARTGSRRASTGVNPRLGPERTSSAALRLLSPGHHRRRGPTSSAALRSPSPCDHHRRRGPTSSATLHSPGPCG